MPNGFYNISCGDMSLDDYKMLCDAVIHMSCDIESNCPRWLAMEFPNGFDGIPTLKLNEAWDNETALKYAYVKYMIDCINDVPNTLVGSAVENGIQLPEIEL